MHVGMGNAPERTPEPTPESTLVEDIDWAGTHGFNLFEVTVAAPGAATEQGNWPAVAAQLRAHPLRVLCRAADYLPIENPSPIVRQAALDELRRTVDVAQLVGAELCTVPFKGWPHTWADTAGYEAYKQLLQILVRHGAERGVAIALENGLNNTHQLKYLREIFKRVPEVGLTLNVGRLNINTARGLTRDYLFGFAERLKHVRLSDNDGSGDQQLPLGAPAAGGLEWANALHELKSFGYRGDISLAIAGDRRWLEPCRAMVVEAWEGQ